MGTSNYALLCRLADHYQSAMMQSTLVANGIDVVATGGETLAAYGDGPGPADLIELWVPTASMEEARRAVQDRRAQPQSADASAWTCAACSESNDANFELCWSCGSASSGSATERA
jgi:membrane protease subunit (stomatin/prohibitin family)